MCPKKTLYSMVHVQNMMTIWCVNMCQNQLLLIYFHFLEIKLGHSAKFLFLCSSEIKKVWNDITSPDNIKLSIDRIFILGERYIKTVYPSHHLTEGHFHIRRSRTPRSKINWDGTKKKRRKNPEQREVFPQDRSNHWKPDRGENQTDVAVMWNSRNAVPSAGRTNCMRCSQGWRNQMATENQHWVLFFLMAIIHRLYKQCQWRWRNSLTLIFHIWYEKPEHWFLNTALQTPPQTIDLPIYAKRVITAESKMSNIISTYLINLHCKFAPLTISSRGR